MNAHSLFNRLCHSSISRCIIVTLVVLAWNSLAFCDEIHDAADSGNLEKVKALLKDNPDLVFSKDTNGWTPLNCAVYSGHRDVAEFLLANKADVNAADNNGETSLGDAAGSGHKDMVELLLANKADVNARDKFGSTPLLFAVWLSKDVVELLLTNGADVNAKDEDGNTPLHCAAGGGNIGTVELLLTNNADVNATNNDGETPLHWATEHGNRDVMDLLRQHGGQDTIAVAFHIKTPTNSIATDNRIFDAAKSGDLEKVMALLKENPDFVSSIDRLGNTPLHIAAEKDRKFVVEFLLESKADVNAASYQGWTPLHIAAQSGYWDVAVLLLAHNADVSARDERGDTPLHSAVWWRHAVSNTNDYKGVVQLLLENKADINAIDITGAMPLHLAASVANKDMVELLLANKAEVNAKNNKRLTPLGCVEDSEKDPGMTKAHGFTDDANDVEELLRQHGAKEMPHPSASTAAQPAPATTTTTSGNGSKQASTQPLTIWQIDDLKNCKEQVSLPPEIVSFIASKEKQANEMAAKGGFELGADLKSFFANAEAGHLRDAEQIRYDIFNDTNNPAGKSPLHGTLADAQLAIEQFTVCDPELVMMAGKDYMDSLPANCIYFGGTDPGRGLPTALCRTPGDPIFVLTQNALCTSDYIQYVRDLYGSRIQLPSTNEIQQCYDSYVADALRKQAGRFGPGEDVQIENGKTNVQGQASVMKLNALIARVIFDKNPDREFYYEQSFTLDWMYPYLSPHGVVMKLNRTPLESISTNDVEQDMAFWTAKISQLQGNAKFATDNTRMIYSHLRGSIAGVYLWRSEPQNTKDAAERQRMSAAAEQGFQQSLELFPISPEAVFGYVNLEFQNQKFQAALDIAKAAAQADPSNQQFKGLVQQVEKTVAEAKPADLGQLEKEFNSNPTNFTAGLDLAHSYLSSGQTNRAFELLDQIVANKDVNASALRNVAQIFAQQQNFGKLETVLSRITEVTPDSPEAWYDLAALESVLVKKSEAITDLKQALDLSSQRLKSNPSAHDLAAQVVNDGHFNSLKNDPEFQSLLPQTAR